MKNDAVDPTFAAPVDDGFHELSRETAPAPSGFGENVDDQRLAAVVNFCFAAHPRDWNGRNFSDNDSGAGNDSG